MDDLPPLPPGYSLQGPPSSRSPDPDLLKPLLEAGAVPTNGYRTPEDIRRLKSQGYKPASNSLHLNGDAVDLTPGKSGLSMSELHDRAQRIADGYPGSKVLNEGDHVHLQLPGWGMAPGTPGTPNSGLPPLPSGYSLKQRGSLSGGNYVPSGAVHDGDTLGLKGGGSGRVLGIDAWELNQQGRRADGTLVPLGIQARDALASQVTPTMPVNDTGAQSYGRPIVTLGANGSDPAVPMLRAGNALAEPQYLQGDPRFAQYMEAERLARENRLGGFGTNAETPSQFRHRDGPWQGAMPGAYGAGSAVFGDEPTPFQGLRPEISQAYIALANNPTTTAAELNAFAKENGFEIDPADADRFVAARSKGAPLDPRVTYREAPRLLTDPGDGKFGTTLRGWAIRSTCSTRLAALSMRWAERADARTSGTATAASVTCCGTTSTRTARSSRTTRRRIPTIGLAASWLAALPCRSSARRRP